VLERAASTAAVLLATISFALVVLVLQFPASDVRWPNLALLLFVISGLLFVACVQAVLWTTADKGGWATFARATYNLGTLALIAGVAVVLTPSGTVHGMRRAVIFTAIGGFVLEIIWTICAVYRGYKGKNAQQVSDQLNDLFESTLSNDQVKALLEKLKVQGYTTAEKMIKRGKDLGRKFNLDDLADPPPA
jgi:hypothetical protein